MVHQHSQMSQSPPSFQTIQVCVQLARRLVQSADANVERCTQLVSDQHLLHQGELIFYEGLFVEGRARSGTFPGSRKCQKNCFCPLVTNGD